MNPTQFVELFRHAVVPLNHYRPIVVSNDATFATAASRRSKLLTAADLPELFPLLTAVKWTADCFALNAVGQPPEAARHLFEQALSHMERQGEGVMLLDEAAYLDHLIDYEIERHVWAHLRYAGLSLIWFAKDHDSLGARVADAKATTLTEVTAGVEYLRKNRLRLRPGAEAANYIKALDTVKLWQAVATERAQHPVFNLSLVGGRVHVQWSAFDRASGRISETEIARLQSLDGQHPLQLVVMRETRTRLEQAVGLKPSTLNFQPSASPELRAAVTAAIAEMEVLRAPLYELPPLQRLGFLDEHETIACFRNLAPLFYAGRNYPVTVATVKVERPGTHLNLQGQRDDVVWSGHEQAYFITGEDGVPHCFMDARFREPTVVVTSPDPAATAPLCVEYTLPELVKHFTVPDVADVTTVFPERYQQNLAALDEIINLINA